MKRRKWTLLILGAIGLTAFALCRTVWGPSSKIAAAESPTHESAHEHESEEMSDAERRYISNQPRHWRYVMLKRN